MRTGNGRTEVGRRGNSPPNVVQFAAPKDKIKISDIVPERFKPEKNFLIICVCLYVRLQS